MKIGLDHYTIAGRGLSPVEALDFVAALGLEGVQFLEPSAVAPGLGSAALRSLRSAAAERGMYLEIGLPSPNPTRRSRAEGREVTAAEHAEGLVREVEAAAELGVRHVRAYLGDRHDRFRRDTPWRTQVEASTDVIRRIEPVLRSNGLRIAIETHADLTVVELLRLVERLGPETAGVTLDTGNLLMRLEDPLPAAERLAPWVLCTHLKDAVLADSPRGFRWQARPIGSGVVPIREIVDLLARSNPEVNLSIELHPRTYDLPTRDPSWLACFPDLPPGAIEAVDRLAARAEALFRGGLARPETVEAIPWTEREVDWIVRSVDYLRRIVPRGEAAGQSSPIGSPS